VPQCSLAQSKNKKNLKNGLKKNKPKAPVLEVTTSETVTFKIYINLIIIP